MTIKPYEKISRLFFYHEILFKMKYLKNKTYIEKSPTQIFPRSVISAWVGACQKKKEKNFSSLENRSFKTSVFTQWELLK